MFRDCSEANTHLETFERLPITDSRISGAALVAQNLSLDLPTDIIDSSLNRITSFKSIL